MTQNQMLLHEAHLEHDICDTQYFPFGSLPRLLCFKYLSLKESCSVVTLHKLCIKLPFVF